MAADEKTQTPGRRTEVPPRRVFLSRGLRRMGVSERRLYSSEFRRVLPDCYTRADEPAEVREIAKTALRRIVPDAVICHVTAAELMGIPLPSRLTWKEHGEIHVRVEPVNKRRSAKGLTVHVRSGGRTVIVDGLRLDWPIGVLLDLAGELTHDELVAAVDALGSRRQELLRIPVETVRVAAQTLRRPGARALRAAAREARDWVDSPQETRTRLLLVRSGYEEPVTNLSVEIPTPESPTSRNSAPPVRGAISVKRPSRSKLYYLDLSYPALKIAIEYDGKDHFTQEQARKDHRKDAALHRTGWTVLRIAASDLKDPTDFFALLDEALRVKRPG